VYKKLSYPSPVILSPEIDRRNFRLGVLNGILYLTGDALVDATLVLVAFLSYLTQSPVLLGLVVPIRDGVWALPQLWVSTFLQSYPRKLRLYQVMSYVSILAWLLLVLAIFFIKNHVWLLVAFFITYTAFNFTGGIRGLPFLEVVSKIIPSRRRGEFFAWRFGIAGIAGIGCSILVRWLIDPKGPLPFPYNFGALATLFLILISIGLLLFCNIEEPPDTQLKPRTSFVKQFQRANQFIHNDANFRRFIIMQSMVMIAGVATPFFAVFVQQQFGVSKAMVGIYLGVTIAANVVSNIVFGSLSSRIGNRILMMIAISTGLVMTGIVLFLAVAGRPLHLTAQVAAYCLIPVFILSGIRTTGVGIAANSLLLDIAPAHSRSLYLGYSQTIMSIVLLTGGLSGWLVKQGGLVTLLIVTFLAHILALLASMRMTEPEKLLDQPG